jgi:chitinase
LYNNPANPDGEKAFSVENIVKYLLTRGVDPSKVVIGVAFYTRGWSKVANNGDSKNPGLFGTADLAGKDADGKSTYGGPNEGAMLMYEKNESKYDECFLM